MRLSLITHTQLRDILAAERLSNIPKLHRLRILGLLIWVRSGMNGENLVMTQSVDGPFIEESCVVDGAVVDHLDESVVFVGNGCVVDIDEAVRASGEEEIVVGWVELKLYHQHLLFFEWGIDWMYLSDVVIVAFDILKSRHAR